MMKHKLKSIYWRLFIIRLSLRWVFKFNLGDRVRYQGETWTLNQGVCAPKWDMLRRDSEGVMHEATAHESDFRKVRSIRGYWRSFQAGYSFYMAYWFDIWVRNGVLPWMRGCNIWGGGKRG